ncbi:hypothetical protein [Kibdelosporangium philippinense]|uniref:hypothetical protein n=1 Tax=Kibdelosporangium philippinense TaxID=211113 RepID=UPI003620A6FB
MIAAKVMRVATEIRTYCSSTEVDMPGIGATDHGRFDPGGSMGVDRVYLQEFVPAQPGKRWEGASYWRPPAAVTNSRARRRFR